MSMPPELPAFQPHDHRACRSDALAAVQAACAARRLRLTPARGFVLETLLESHTALTAYELLDRMRAARVGRQPPIVYRALEFLVTNGFVHRVERLGGYVACTGGGADHAAAFTVCRKCRIVAETALAGAGRGLAAKAAASGFAVERVVLEVEGLCRGCRGGSA